MQAPGRNWRMIAAGVALALVVLAVVGRLQSRGLGTGRTGPSVITPATGSADGTSASRLSLTGRVSLPGRRPPSRLARVRCGCCWSRAPCCG